MFTVSATRPHDEASAPVIDWEYREAGTTSRDRGLNVLFGIVSLVLVAIFGLICLLTVLAPRSSRDADRWRQEVVQHQQMLDAVRP